MENNQRNTNKAFPLLMLFGALVLIVSFTRLANATEFLPSLKWIVLLASPILLLIFYGFLSGFLGVMTAKNPEHVKDIMMPTGKRLQGFRDQFYEAGYWENIDENLNAKRDEIHAAQNQE